MSVHDFQTRVNEICEYFPFMPRPRETIPVTRRLPPPHENDKIAILYNACPRSWRDEQARINQLDLSLQQLLTYYSTLKSIERSNDDGRPTKERRKREMVEKDIMIYRNHSLEIPCTPFTEITVYLNAS